MTLYRLYVYYIYIYRKNYICTTVYSYNYLASKSLSNFPCIRFSTGPISYIITYKSNISCSLIHDHFPSFYCLGKQKTRNTISPFIVMKPTPLRNGTNLDESYEASRFSSKIGTLERKMKLVDINPILKPNYHYEHIRKTLFSSYHATL